VVLNQIENEYQETVYDPNHTSVIYMKQIEKAFQDAGVIVPSTHNEKGMRAQSWSSDYKNVGGAVNIYGLDSYPGGFSCTDASAGFNVVRTYFQWFSKYSFTQPSYLAEFEGGWFSNWGGGTFYDDVSSVILAPSPFMLTLTRWKVCCRTQPCICRRVLQEQHWATGYAIEHIHDIWRNKLGSL
jgi:hypothetical protein